MQSNHAINFRKALEEFDALIASGTHAQSHERFRQAAFAIEARHKASEGSSEDPGLARMIRAITQPLRPDEGGLTFEPEAAFRVLQTALAFTKEWTEENLPQDVKRLQP